MTVFRMLRGVVTTCERLCGWNISNGVPSWRIRSLRLTSNLQTARCSRKGGLSNFRGLRPSLKTQCQIWIHRASLWPSLRSSIPRLSSTAERSDRRTAPSQQQSDHLLPHTTAWRVYRRPGNRRCRSLRRGPQQQGGRRPSLRRPKRHRADQTPGFLSCGNRTSVLILRQSTSPMPRPVAQDHHGRTRILLKSPPLPPPLEQIQRRLIGICPWKHRPGGGSRRPKPWPDLSAGPCNTTRHPRFHPSARAERARLTGPECRP